jgi:electron transfer flavoprotein beta subunit
MNIVVVLKMVPDVVEELEVDLEGARMILSESDDHALEEALLLKERHGGTVKAIALDAPEVDDALFTALAKGADKAVKVAGIGAPIGTVAAAQVLAGAIPEAELVLTGTQAIDDLDGLLAPLLAYHLKTPSLSVLTSVKLDGDGKSATVVKELPGGLRAEYQLTLPAVLGIQAAEKPPRYVPVAKVRAAMKSQHIETIVAPDLRTIPPSKLEILSRRKPEAAGHAEMLQGAPDVVAGKLSAVFAEHGVL